MSQKKVEAYKKEKRNRKKNLIREKRMRILGRLAAVICICLFVGAVYYIVKNPTNNQSGADAAQTDMEDLQQQLMEQLNASGAAVSTDGSITLDGISGENNSSDTDSADGKDNSSDADSPDGEGSSSNVDNPSNADNAANSKDTSSDGNNSDGNADSSNSDGE